MRFKKPRPISRSKEQAPRTFVADIRIIRGFDVELLSEPGRRLYMRLWEASAAREELHMPRLGAELGMTTAQRVNAHCELVEAGAIEYPPEAVEALRRAIGRSV